MRNARGEWVNRIRKGEWAALFSKITNLETQFIYSWERKDVVLPERIDASIIHDGEKDLRVSHIGVLATKRPGE